MSTIIIKKEIINILDEFQSIHKILSDEYSYLIISTNNKGTLLKIRKEKLTDANNIYNEIIALLNKNIISYQIYEKIYFYIMKKREVVLNGKPIYKNGKDYITFEKSKLNTKTFDNYFPSVNSSIRNQKVSYNLIDLLKKTLNSAKQLIITD